LNIRPGGKFGYSFTYIPGEMPTKLQNSFNWWLEKDFYICFWHFPMKLHDQTILKF